jgi:SAM-dependent methyltransferase
MILDAADVAPAGVSDQFLGNAATYHSRYFRVEEMRRSLDNAFELARINTNSIGNVLDFGTGDGSSAIALAQLLPAANVAACDISPMLLEILSKIIAADERLSQVISLYCFDLYKPFFRQDTFDLAVGSAILHHLLDPRAALEQIANTLRPGGRIILFEPTEGGAHIVAAMYQAMIDQLNEDPIAHGRLIALLQAMLIDFEARFGVPRAKPWTADLDDKWLFSYSYFLSLANDLGLNEVNMYPQSSNIDDIYTKNFQTLISVSGNIDIEIPSFIWKTASEFDNIPSSIKKNLTPEATIIFRK